MTTGYLARRQLPRLPITRVAPITQHRRLELLGQVLTDDHGPLRSRVAACLMLLFAQPATRIVRLTIDNITRTADGGVVIRFGEPPTPVPEPFATLLLQATAQRDNLQTATNPGTRQSLVELLQHLAATTAQRPATSRCPLAACGCCSRRPQASCLPQGHHGGWTPTRGDHW